MMQMFDGYDDDTRWREDDRGLLHWYLVSVESLPNTNMEPRTIIVRRNEIEKIPPFLGEYQNCIFKDGLKC